MGSHMNRPVFALGSIVLLVGSMAIAGGSAQDHRLTRSDLADAIALGVNGTPSPYFLRQLAYNDRASKVVVAAIYTPFVRVAFAAKAAHSEGRAMTPDDVHDALLKPELYVAFRGGSDDIATSFSATGFNLQSASAYRGALPGDRFPSSSRPDLNIRLVASPLWVTEELTILTDFGAEAPFDDTVLIAAYPMSVLASGHDFVIYRTFRPSNGDTYGRQYRVGRVLASDLTWR